MACFLTPATAAIITHTVKKKIPPKYHPEWLLSMFWGGVVMLVIEHISHKEIVIWPPFLTAMQNPANIPQMLQEIITVGGSMTGAIILIWIILLLTNSIIQKFNRKENKTFKTLKTLET